LATPHQKVKPAIMHMTRAFAFSLPFAQPVVRHCARPFPSLNFTSRAIGLLCALTYNNESFSAAHNETSTRVSRYRYIHRGKATLLVRDEAIFRRDQAGHGFRAHELLQCTRSFCRSGIIDGY
jgi:hypothetical protein